MEALAERLREASETGRLNLSYLGTAAAVNEAVTQVAGAGTLLRISELDLSSNALEELPAGLGSVAAFAGLRVLRAKYNRLQELPGEQLAAALPRLAELDLEGNQVAALDEAALPALTALRRLNLSSNGLVALPDSVGRCRMLEALAVSNNPLAQLPEALASCPVLAHLDVSSCRLVSVPPALGHMKSLQRFFCQNNDLQRVPTALGHLSNLKEWNLRANRLPLKYEQARERGLAKFLAFLREEEEIEMLQEIERNRPVGIASGPCMVYRCKAILDDAMVAGQRGESVDGFAWIRSGYAVAQHRSSVYVFGGVVVRDGRKTSELLVLNTDTMSWRAQPTRGDRPCPRDGHLMVADPTSGTAGQLLVFGGRNSSGRRLNDLHALDVATWTWFVPKQEGAALPSPREQAAAAIAPDGRLLLFGGRTNGARLNDLWSWDAQSGCWDELPVHGTAPSPRQGAAACVAGNQLFIMGGMSNFVLHDCCVYNLETQEWRALNIEGRSKAAGRGGGHIITWQPDVEEGSEEGADGEEAEEAGGPGGSLWMFGGRDVLGAQVAYLLKLKARMGGAWYEWVETEFSMQPNTSRIILFDSAGRLSITQCGHPLHKLTVSSEQIDKGSCIWDVVQLVPLTAVQEKVVSPEDLVGANPKRERIKHATLIAAKLPRAFNSHTPREQQLLVAASGFKERVLAAAAARGSPDVPERMPPPVVLLNECGVEKMVCTTLRRTMLPHPELHDLDTIAQFVGEFFNCEPLEDLTQLPANLVSPWSLLEWQAGDTFDLATLACSLLLGAGYNAFVVVGYASTKLVAMCDQSHSECPLLLEHGVEAPPYAEIQEDELSYEDDSEEDGEEDMGLDAEGQEVVADAASHGAALFVEDGAAAGDMHAASGAAQRPGSAGKPATGTSRPATATTTVAFADSRSGSTAGTRPTTGAPPAGSRPATAARSSTGTAAAASRPATAASKRSTAGKAAAGSRPETAARPASKAAAAKAAAAAAAAAAGSRPATGKTAAAGKTAAGKAAGGKAAAGKAGSRPATNKAKQAERSATPAATDTHVAPSEEPAVSAEAADAEAAVQGPETLLAEGIQEQEMLLQAPAESVLPPCRRKRYVHCWVLVKPGRREVAQAVLLDPATGRQYTMDTAPCSGAECAWNDRNFWVSLQTDSSSAGSGGCGLAEVGMTNWTFSNPNCWAAMLVTKEDHQAEAATITTQLSHQSSRLSEMLSRTTSSLPGRMSTLSSCKGFSPRSHALLSNASAAMAAAAAAGGIGSVSGPSGLVGTGAGAAGSGPLPASALAAAPAAARGSGVTLQHLSLGRRSGTPRLSVYAPTREMADSSLGFLSPEETAVHQRSSMLPMPSSFAPPSTACPGTATAAGTSPSPTPPREVGTSGSGGSSLGQPAEVPLSWVPPLSISRERLDMRCPRGSKTVTYRQARRELYARYGECGRWDGLVERLSTYDGATSAPLCLLELFSRRKDKLARRLAHPGQRTTTSSYEAGAPGCLRSVRVVRGMGLQRQVELTFDAHNRADGLLRRLRAGNCMEEWFLPGSRPDGLIRRVVHYAAADGDTGAAGSYNRGPTPLGIAAVRAGSAGGAGASRMPGGGHRRRSSLVIGADAEDQLVRSILEEFSSGASRQAQAVQQSGSAAATARSARAAPATPPAALATGPTTYDGLAVVQRRFGLTTDQLELVARPTAAGMAEDHGAEDNRVVRTYGLGGDLLEQGSCQSASEAAAVATPLHLLPDQQRHEYAALLAASHAALSAVRAAEEESRDILVAMQRQELGAALITPHYDATRIKVEDSDDEGAVIEEETDAYDFLQHFLPHTGARDLTAAEAEEAQAACLAAFDDRQADRQRLLTSRLCECTAELARLRSVLHSELHHLTPADQERVRAEEAGAAFRTRVVQRRVDEHAPAGAVKRAELQARLTADKRLAVAMASGQ